MARLIECVPNFSEGRDASKVDAIAAAGPSYATCTISQAGTQTSSSHGQSTAWTGRMDGKGWHATAEAGVRLDWRLARPWAAFVEGTYRYERFPSVTGTSAMQSAATAGAVGTRPISPTPLAPNGPSGCGSSTRITTTSGMS